MLRFMYDTEDQLRGVVNEAGEEYIFELDAQGDVNISHLIDLHYGYGDRSVTGRNCYFGITD